jgi:FkbM family methyltransferase
MYRIRKKFKTLLSIDPKWAYRFLRKRATHQMTFLWSRLIGRRYWDADVVGVPLRFVFFSPYHHRIAYFFHQGSYERSALLVWKEKAKESSVIYDIGGFNGIFGLLAAKVNPQARVVIFEPDAVSARHIRENIKANGLINNCTIEEVAISDSKGTVRFSQGGSTGERLADHGREVRAETLDDLPPADLIKIDVEGAEAKVIAGGLHALKRKPIISVEVHPWLSESDQEKMWATLKELGYSWKTIGDNVEGNPHYLVT